MPRFHIPAHDDRVHWNLECGIWLLDERETGDGPPGGVKRPTAT